MAVGTAKDPTTERIIFDELTVLQHAPVRERRIEADTARASGNVMPGEDLRGLSGVHIGDSPSTQSSSVREIIQARVAAPEETPVSPPLEAATVIDLAQPGTRARSAEERSVARADEVVSDVTSRVSSVAGAAGREDAPGRPPISPSDVETGVAAPALLVGVPVEAIIAPAAAPPEKTHAAPLEIDLDLTAETPSLVVGAAVGFEDHPIALSIAAGLTDTDGSETLRIKIGRAHV